MDLDSVQPKLLPLFEDLSNLTIRLFLVSPHFNRALIKRGYESLWHDTLKEQRGLRSYLAPGYNHAPFDAEKALRLMLSAAFNSNKQLFEDFLYFVLDEFINYIKLSSAQFAPIREDLQIIHYPPG